MAIAYDAESTNNGGNWTRTVSSFGWSHTCTGSDRTLVVGVKTYDATLKTVTGITYNGVALTKINSITGSVESFAQSTELWYLVAPSTGANTITVTLSAVTDYMTGSGVSYTGVDQTSPIDSNNTAQNQSASTSFSISTTVVASNCWLTGTVFPRGTLLSAGTGTVLRGYHSGSDSSSADSNTTVATGSQSLNFTNSNAATTWPGAVIASITPVGGAASTFIPRIMMS